MVIVCVLFKFFVCILVLSNVAIVCFVLSSFFAVYCTGFTITLCYDWQVLFRLPSGCLVPEHSLAIDLMMHQDLNSVVSGELFPLHYGRFRMKRPSIDALYITIMVLLES